MGIVIVMEREQRRAVLIAAGLAGAGALLSACRAAGPQGGEEEVSPVEDLMREHGVLRRVLLVYAEIDRRIEQREPFPLDVLAAGAGILRRFIEDYHEKLEEDHVFPRFERAHAMVDLVAVLRVQHQAGRRVTDAILARGTPASVQASIRTFARMYRPHSAREDTVLFPAFRALVGAKEYAELGEAFEEKEHALFGPKGFEGIVAEVAQLEMVLGIHDLAQFTPA